MHPKRFPLCPSTLGNLLATGGLLTTLFACAAAPAPVHPKFPDRSPDQERITADVSPAPSEAAPANFEILAVSVRPPKVRRGDQVELVVSYRTGAGARVSEDRILSKDGKVIIQLHDALDRDAGDHVSSKPVRVPLDAAPGLYTFDVTLAAGGTRIDGSALFEVR